MPFCGVNRVTSLTTRVEVINIIQTEAFLHILFFSSRPDLRLIWRHSAAEWMAR
jgi:hypothetical protein